MKFWTTVPLDLRYKQNLYKKYLTDWNYKDIFESINDKVTGFTGLNNLTLKLFIFSKLYCIQKNKEKIIIIVIIFQDLAFNISFMG